jgi:hypothetical protein
MALSSVTAAMALSSVTAAMALSSVTVVTNSLSLACHKI